MSRELDLENDQSIIDSTILVPQRRGYFTMEIEMPDGTKIEHTELTAEDARKVMSTWCAHVRESWRQKEANEADRQTRAILAKRREREAAEAEAASPAIAARDAELKAKLPASERELDERRGNGLVKPKPRDAKEGAPAHQDAPRYAASAVDPVYVREATGADPLAYAKQQYVYWSEEETKLEHATKMRTKWERVLQVLREDE